MTDTAPRSGPVDCVVDAGALLALLLPGPRAHAVQRALAGRRMAAPSHVDLDVLALLCAQERAGSVDPRRVNEVLAALHATPVDRYSVLTLARPIWALREVLPAHQASYVALAARLCCPLLTTDRHLAATPGLPAPVIAVSL